jgi:hypothetical protein
MLKMLAMVVICTIRNAPLKNRRAWTANPIKPTATENRTLRSTRACDRRYMYNPISRSKSKEAKPATR